MFQYNAVFALLELKQLHWRGMKKLIHKCYKFMTMMLFVVMETPHNSSTCLSLTSVGERELSSELHPLLKPFTLRMYSRTEHFIDSKMALTPLACVLLLLSMQCEYTSPHIYTFFVEEAKVIQTVVNHLSKFLKCVSMSFPFTLKCLSL